MAKNKAFWKLLLQQQEGVPTRDEIKILNSNNIFIH